MSLQRDYILRLVEQLREFLTQIVRLRLAERPDDALVAIMNAQERLFARPAAQFIALPPEEQFRILTFGEAEREACAKCIMQADLLSETARVYADKEQPALALGAWHYARQLLELTIAKYPEADGDATMSGRIAAARREITLLR